MNELNKEDIKNIFGQIETPEYNATDDIKNKINQGYKIKPKMSRMKRTAIIAAAIMIVLVLMSAGIQFIRIKVFNEDGSFYFIDRRLSDKFRMPRTDEQGLFEREFFDQQNNENLFVRTVNPYNGGFANSNPYRTITSFEELQNYVDDEVYKIPQYLPDGYIFKQADISFYLDEDFDLGNAELVERVEKFDNIYEKYYIPENPKNIDYISVSYTNGNSDDADLYYSIYLHESGALNMTFSGNENTEYEKLDLSQFLRSAMLSTYYNYTSYENGKAFTSYWVTGLNTIPVRYGLNLSQEYHNKREYGTVQYNIVWNCLDDNINARDEIIKIAQSIK